MIEVRGGKGPRIAGILSEATRESAIVHSILRCLLWCGIGKGADDFMECSVEGKRKVEWLLEQAFCEFGIVGADVIYTDNKSSLVFLQHQYDV